MAVVQSQFFHFFSFLFFFLCAVHRSTWIEIYLKVCSFKCIYYNVFIHWKRVQSNLENVDKCRWTWFNLKKKSSARMLLSDESRQACSIAQSDYTYALTIGMSTYLIRLCTSTYVLTRRVNQNRLCHRRGKAFKQRARTMS